MIYLISRNFNDPNVTNESQRSHVYEHVEHSVENSAATMAQQTQNSRPVTVRTISPQERSNNASQSTDTVRIASIQSLIDFGKTHS